MTNTRNTVTVDQVEFVEASTIVVGDVLVAFTAIGAYTSVPPTQRQLNAKRTVWTTVDTIGTWTTPHGREILEFNGGAVDNPTSGVSVLPTAFVWRVKRDA